MKQQKLSAIVIIKILIIALPIVWGFYIVTKYGVNIIFMDEWTYVDNKDRFMTLNYLWEQHNEHRMFFPKIITYIVGQLFSWNSKMFMYTSQLFLLFLYVIVILILLGEEKHLTWLRTLQSFLLGMCIYNTCQYENLLSGFQIAWFIIVSLGAASFYFFETNLKTGKKKYLILSLTLAIIVSFSSLHGLTIWGGYTVLLLLLIINKEKIPSMSYLCTFIVAICSVSIYFMGYQSIAGHKALLGQNIEQILSYFIAQIGTTMLSDKVIFSHFLGLTTLFLIVLTLLHFIIKKEIKSHVKIIGPIIMSCGILFITSIGRSGGGEFVASRYTTNGMLFLTFFLLTGFEIISKLSTKQMNPSIILYTERLQDIMINVFIILTIVLPVLVLVRNFTVLPDINDFYVNHLHAKLEMVNYETISLKGLQTFAPANENNMSKYIENINYLKEYKLNAFCDDNSELLYLETKLPETTSSDYLPNDIFTSRNVSVTGNNITVSINEFEEIENKNLSDYQFYLRIKDKTYHMPLDNDCVRFERKMLEIDEGVNELQLILVQNNTAYYSKTICLLKYSEYGWIADSVQEDHSVLSGYAEIKDTRTYAIDTLNDGIFSDNNIIYNYNVSSISGWIQESEISDKKCYLRIGDAYFELFWTDRQDVIDAFGNNGYHGFYGTFLPVAISTERQDTAIIIIDMTARTYIETVTDVPIIIQ